ncbi:TPA: histidine phosphatase family protein [Legionella pneumophila]
MKNTLLYVLLVHLFFPNAYALSEEKLLFSIDLIRHGDRTPTSEIPKAPYHWQEGLGELTEKGINQEIQLGKKLREKYVTRFHLLPENYKLGSLYTRSTNIKRTTTSANLLLLGLYPPNKRDDLNQEITIDTISIDKDNLLIVKPSKNIFALAKVFFVSHQTWKIKTVNIKNKLKYWSAQTGIKLINFQQLDRLADNLYIRKLHQIPLPRGISSDDASEIIALSEWAQINYFKLTEISYPTGHEFIKTASNYFDQSIHSNSQLKYVLYSAHDSSIMSVMTTLGTPLNEIPHYASSLNFSLFQRGIDYYVRVSYNDKIVKIPRCGKDYCTLSQFKELF